MFLASVVVIAPAYILLAVPRTFWGFLGVYLLVAVGHGMFKPVVISTVAKTTTEETGAMGFGVSYMMVNIDGVTVKVVSFFIYLAGATGWVVVTAVLVFSVGEMLASPRSKEYAGRITTAVALIIYNKTVTGPPSAKETL